MKVLELGEGDVLIVAGVEVLKVAEVWSGRVFVEVPGDDGTDAIVELLSSKSTESQAVCG